MKSWKRLAICLAALLLLGGHCRGAWQPEPVILSVETGTMEPQAPWDFEIDTSAPEDAEPDNHRLTKTLVVFSVMAVLTGAPAVYCIVTGEK